MPNRSEEAPHRTVATRLKRTTCAVSLKALGVMFELCSEHVAAMQQEIADWPDGLRVEIGVLPAGPCIMVIKDGARLAYLGGCAGAEADLSIMFKNLDSALLIFTGQLGAAHAVAENRIVTKGNNYIAMQATRGMAIVQTYLFPALITSRTFKRPPRLGAKDLAIKGMLMGLLPGRLALAWNR